MGISKIGDMSIKYLHVNNYSPNKQQPVIEVNLIFKLLSREDSRHVHIEKRSIRFVFFRFCGNLFTCRAR